MVKNLTFYKNVLQAKRVVMIMLVVVVALW